MAIAYSMQFEEGSVPPLLFLLMEKIVGTSGELVVTDEEMERLLHKNYVLESWYDLPRCQMMYRLKVKERPVVVVDGEVVEDEVPLPERRSITDGR